MAEMFYGVWANLHESLTIQVFVISLFVLIVGLILMGWYYGMRLSHLESESIAHMEEEHPHIPSVKVLGGIFLSSVCLLAAAYLALLDVPPFDQPYQFVYLAAILVLGGAAGVLSELYFKNGRDFPFAFTIGTSLAFLFLSFSLTIPHGTFLEAVSLLMILIACIVLARRVFFPTWSNRVQISSLLVFMFWVIIYGPLVLESLKAAAK